MTINLLLGKCEDKLKEIPEHSVDLLLTDPPYNISRKTNFQTLKGASRQGMDFGEWDKNCDLISWIEPMSKTLKENANVIIFNTWDNLAMLKPILEKNHMHYKRLLTLSKSNPAPFNRDRMFVNDTENAIWCVYNSKDKPTGWVFNRTNPLEKCVIKCSVQSSKYHPTMKDQNVIDYLVKLLSNENQTVLDCFMGSGTTGIACKKFNRNFIGIELDPKYYEISKQRIYETH